MLCLLQNTSIVTISNITKNVSEKIDLYITRESFYLKMANEKSKAIKKKRNTPIWNTP